MYTIAPKAIYNEVIVPTTEAKCLADINLLFKVRKNSQCCKSMYELMFANLNYFKLHF